MDMWSHLAIRMEIQRQTVDQMRKPPKCMGKIILEPDALKTSIESECSMH